MSFQNKLELRGLEAHILTPKIVGIRVNRVGILDLYDCDRNLIGLSTGGETLVSTYDVIKLKVADSPIELESRPEHCSFFRVRAIRKVTDSRIPYDYELMLFDDTYCNIFLLPLIGFNSAAALNGSYFINSYIDVKDSRYAVGNGGSDCIHLLYRYCDAYNEFEESLKRLPNIVHIRDHGEYVIYTFRVKEAYAGSCEAFIQSRYSAIPDEAKKQILSFHRFKKNGTLGGILYKHLEAKRLLEQRLTVKGSYRVHLPDNAELFNCIDFHIETLFLDELDLQQNNQ